MLNGTSSTPIDPRAVDGQTPADTTGRDAAFDALFRAHYADVLRYALRRLSDRAAAEDIAADTFVVAWRRFDAIPQDEFPWLLGIARHAIQNQKRSERRRSRLIARLHAHPHKRDQDPTESLASADDEDVLAALSRLDERDQEVLRLAAFEGLDPQRAAAVLGCSRGALAVRLHRARKRLAKQLMADPQPSPQARARHGKDDRSEGKT
jgi:RNA polymerase sigma-70 factor (ECF subfamily)